jgi:hypothetical protein
MLLVWSAVALASDVDVAVVDVTAPTGSVTLSPGQSGNLTINMSVTGNQVGIATFEVYRDWTLSEGAFVGSDPEEFTVAPRAGGDPATTFSTTGTVTVTGDQAEGTFTLSVGAFDITNTNSTGAKLEVGDSGSYQVTVEAPAAPSDTTAPVITPGVSGTLGSNGWYTSDVAVSWAVNDAESAVTSQSGCDPTTVDYDTSGVTFTCSATSAGGTDSESVTIKRDATQPSVSLVGGPASGQSYYFGSVPEAPTCDALDTMSGLDGQCSVTGYGTGVGSHTVVAAAKDLAGNTNSDSSTYTVLAWTLAGFDRPVEMPTAASPMLYNTVKGGSTVPLKFEVFAGSTELTNTTVVKGFSVQKLTCVAGTEEDAVDFTTTGGTSLRYDTVDGKFVQNWQTPKAAGVCYRVTMTTQDESSLVAYFKTK